MSASTLSTRDDILRLAREVRESKKHLNNLNKLLEYAESNDNETIFYSIKALQRVFVQLIGEGFVEKIGLETTKKKRKVISDSQLQIKRWVHKKFLTLMRRLLDILNTSDEPGLQIPALEALMEIVKEASISHSREEARPPVFTNTLFKPVISHLILSENFNSKLLNAFREKYLWKYDDVRYFMLKSIREILEEYQSAKTDEEKAKAKHFLDISNKLAVSEDIICNNIYQLISDMRMPTETSELDGWFVGDPNDGLESKETAETSANTSSKSKKRKRSTEKEKKTIYAKLINLEDHRRIFTNCWLEFLKLSLPMPIYKKVLTNIQDIVLPHITNVHLLVDFLTASFNQQGIIPILALHGIFVMISKYNFEYPEFYKKLYNMLEPSIFYYKYRSKFFTLLDLFMRSTHLPTYLVCAFAKKMARLALIAPPYGCCVLLPLIYNLLITHISAQVLVHRAAQPTTNEQPVLLLNINTSEIVKQDPFDFNEQDPAKCQAINSSLWELKALSNHYVPSVATLAKLFAPGSKFTRQRFDVSDFADLTYTELSVKLGK